MGFGTVWLMGQKSEARLLFNGQVLENRPEVYAKFVTEVELQCLRCVLHGMAKYDPTIKVHEGMFPGGTDPEWDEWYANINEDYTKGVDFVAPEFLHELSMIPADKVDGIAASWSTMMETHREPPVENLRELIQFAKAAIEQNMSVLSRTIGI